MEPVEDQPAVPYDQLAAESLAHGDATGWFDEVYKAAGDDPTKIPWADQEPNPWLVEWLERERPEAKGSTAVVVGSGLGDDAEELSRRGFEVTGFDISPTAIEWARRRFPESAVEYRIADLFDLPPLMERAFDFVFEAYTLQPLPEGIRGTAIATVASLVAPGGSLLIVSRGRENHEPVAGPPPWPLSRAELEGFEHAGLLQDSFEEWMDDTRDPPILRFRAHYLRPAT
jgi:ubiquinone/menaquinone biosynthesis C-methylase UbiE